jgi:hypothetical protein
MLGVAASFSLQYALVRVQSIWLNQVTADSNDLRNAGRARARKLFCRELRVLRKSV